MQKTADVQVMLLFSFVTTCLLSIPAIFCDYYNNPGDCEWHYKPCGADCMKTCRNPSGNCTKHMTALEGEAETTLFFIFFFTLLLTLLCH